MSEAIMRGEALDGNAATINVPSSAPHLVSH
jgi:hypothetical protein